MSLLVTPFYIDNLFYLYITLMSDNTKPTKYKRSAHVTAIKGFSWFVGIPQSWLLNLNHVPHVQTVNE